MKKVIRFVIVILFATCSVNLVYSQAKKVPVKKPAVVAKSKVPAKTNTAVAAKANVPAKANTVAAKTKLPVKNKPAITAKKIAPPVKPVNNTTLTPAVPNKQVNNAEVLNVTLTSREQEMINEINLLRTNPARYCTYVEEYLQKHDADEEVKQAAKELVGILKKLKSLNPLTINPVMYNDARQHGLLMAKKNVFEHSSLPYAENLSLGYKDIRDAIVDLLIDEGIPDRGHRKNLLSEKIKHVAIYELPGKIQDIAYCYVQEFK